MNARMVASLTLILLLAAAGSAAAESVTPAERVEFEDLPKRVAERNPHVDGARLKHQAAGELTGHLTRSFLPTLEARGGAEAYKVGRGAGRTEPHAEIETRANLFRGGRDVLEERAREAQAEAARAGFDQAYMEELAKARRAYWTLVYQREMLALLADAIERNDANLEAANRRVRAGLATPTDRIEFEMYRVQLEQDRARMTLGSANTQRTLNVLIGNAEDVAIETPATIPHTHDNALFKTAFDVATHRDVRALAASGDVASSQRSQAYRWWIPSLDLYAGYAVPTGRDAPPGAPPATVGDRQETGAGVRVTLQLFDGLHARAAGSAAALQAEGYSRQATQTGRELSAQFEGAKQELALTMALAHTAEMSVEKGADYLARTQAEYQRGAKNSPDVFAATEKFIELKRRYAEIRRDYQLAKSDLMAMLGQ